MGALSTGFFFRLGARFEFEGRHSQSHGFCEKRYPGIKALTRPPSRNTMKSRKLPTPPRYCFGG